MKQEANFDFSPGTRYQHFKGGTYRIVLIALDSETQEQVIVYRSIQTDDIWTRKLTDFCEWVEDKVYKDRFGDEQMYTGWRFTQIEE